MESARASAPLNRDEIVRRALAVADRDGLAAVSMRRVGAELGYSGMSLYGYVSSKDELLELLVDHVFGLVPEIDDGLPPQEAITGFFARLREVMLEHPAVGRIAAEHPAQGGHAQRHARRVVGLLRRGGVPGPLAVQAFIALTCYTIGGVVYAAGRSEATDEGWARFGAAFAEEAIDPDALAAALATRAGPDQFRGGLEHLVRGYLAAA